MLANMILESAREMGIDYTEVTKFGGGSYINVGKTKTVKGNER